MKADDQDSHIREEYDFSDGVRGKYADRFAEGSNVVVLDPDLAAEFKTRKAVDDALRAQLENGRRASGRILGPPHASKPFAHRNLSGGVVLHPVLFRYAFR